MRRKLIAGNWKMNTSVGDALRLVSKLKPLVKNVNKLDIVVCPPFTNICAVNQLLRNSNIKLGAQDIFWEEKGAYTGEISPSMLKSVGCSYVIIGHSERRRYFKETDEDVNRKINSALSHGLKPIVCVGETFKERKAGKQKTVVERQIKKGLEGIKLKSAKNLVVAYEPVWAIGTGKTATPEEAEEMHTFIRSSLSKLYRSLARDILILYGGSIKPENARELFLKNDVDGGLVGGSSLNAKEFLSIIKSA